MQQCVLGSDRFFGSQLSSSLSFWHTVIIASRPILVLLLAALIAFGASLGGSFYLDDHSLFSQDLWRPIEPRPLTYLTFWINQRLGGENPAGYHAVNLGLHLLAVALLFRTLSRLISSTAAFASAAVFAVHPFAAEPVNYVFERSTILATVFCLAALAAWIQERHWLATLWFVAALLSKEECVAFPLFLLLLHLTGPRRRRELRAIAVMLALAVVAGIRVWISGNLTPGSGVASHAGTSAGEYFVIQGGVILKYLRMLIVPWGFTVDPDIRVTRMLGWLAWGALAEIVWVAARRFSERRQGFWFIGGLLLLLPSSSIFPAADLAADRRMYLPMIAFSVVIGMTVTAIRREIAVAAVAVLSILSLQRTLVWHSPESLWADAVVRAPGKVRPKIQLARSVGGARGLEILQDAQRISPDDPAIASEEGRIALTLGDGQRALIAFGRALALDPANAAAHNNRGVALLTLGQREAARADFERALHIDPCEFDARLNLLRLGEDRAPAPECRFSREQTEALRTTAPR